MFLLTGIASILNVLTNRPVLGRVEGAASLEFDDRDTLPGNHFGLVGRATINVPVSETSALRLNLDASFQDPIVKIVNTDPPGVRRETAQKILGGRLKYLWSPSERLSVYLIGDYTRQRGTGGGDNDQSSRVNGGGLFAAGLAQDGIVSGPDNFRSGADGALYSDLETGGVSLNVQYKLTASLSISNIAAWRRLHTNYDFDFDYTSKNYANNYNAGQSFNQYSDELRLTLQPGKLIDGQIGLYFFKRTQGAFQDLQATAGTARPNYLGTDVLSDVSSRSLAAYGQANLHLTDKLNLIGGARVTNDHVSLDLTQNFGTYVVTILGPKAVRLNQSFDNTQFNYKVGAQYQLDPNVMAYATYSTGFKGASFNQSETFAGQNLLVRPETVRDVEVGLRTTTLDGRARLNISGFLENFSDLQVSSYFPAAATYITANAAKARSIGAEISGMLKPFGGLTLNAAVTVVDAHFTDFPDSQCYPGQQLASCVATGRFNAAGVQLPRSARFTSTAEAMYEFPISAVSKAFVEGNYFHRSSINYSAAGDPRVTIGSADLIGLSAGVRLPGGVELSIFCKNCTDQHLPNYVYIDILNQALSKAVSVDQVFGYNSVRTLGARISVSF